MREILEKLKEGQGMVLVSKNGKSRIYGEIQILNRDGKEKIVRLFAGASVLYGRENVKIIIKKEDKIEFLEEEDLKFL